ncbi:MAG TPA: hypothetical protein VMJ10_18760 [Kofleriaceae bacterium]|nr:hypothetical protein [Kofleriaceae bacterium]
MLCVAVVVACSLPALPPLSDAGAPLPSCGSASGLCLALLAGGIGGPGNVDGTGSAARFSTPQGVAIDGTGNLYVGDRGNNVIRKVSPTGVVTTFAGMTGVAGSADGTGSAAQFTTPFSIATDAAGNLYVADYGDAIREITPDGTVTTIAGIIGMAGSADGTGSAARFSTPEGVAVDGSGNVYVADTGNNTIRMIAPGGVVTTIAGHAGSTGSADGNGSAARFKSPTSLALDGSGNLYVADSLSDTIRKITPQGDVTTFAGLAGITGSTDGTGSAARFDYPDGLAFDAAGDLLVADAHNSTVRKIDPAGAVTTWLGNPNMAGSADGTGSAALFRNPAAIAVDSAGAVYVTDAGADTIRKVTPARVVTTLAGLATSFGSADGTGSAAQFFGPTGVGVGSGGLVYVADTNNCTLRAVTPAGVVTTLAGSAGIEGSGDGSGVNARFSTLRGVAVAGSGIIYVADTAYSTIRAVTPAGAVTTLAGLAETTGSADGVGSGARFNSPWDVAVDGSGNVYVADYGNTSIRKVTPAGAVTTLAGAYNMIGSADGLGSAARFDLPTGIAADAAGNVYVADGSNCTIRAITPAGLVTTLAGLAGACGSADGTGSAAQFGIPTSVAVDPAGNVYVADTANATIRKVTPAGVVTTIAGTAGVRVIQLGTSPGFAFPTRVAIDGDSLVISDSGAILVLAHAVQ